MAIITALKIALAPNVDVSTTQVPVTVVDAATPTLYFVLHSVQLFLGPTVVLHPVGVS